jgi:hypothetical protein
MSKTRRLTLLSDQQEPSYALVAHPGWWQQEKYKMQAKGSLNLEIIDPIFRKTMQHPWMRSGHVRHGLAMRARAVHYLVGVVVVGGAAISHNARQAQAARPQLRAPPRPTLSLLLPGTSATIHSPIRSFSAPYQHNNRSSSAHGRRLTTSRNRLHL